MERKFAQLTKNKKMFAALGTSSIFVSSGVVAWELYQVQTKKQGTLDNVSLPTEKKQKEGTSKPQYIPVPRHILDNINQFEEMKLSPAETKEDIKSIIPKHLRKPWRLMEQANKGEYEQHLKAVKELSKLFLSDGEMMQLAQCCSRRTAVGLARSEGVDLRYFLSKPLPPDIVDRDIVDMFREILLKLPSDSSELHECIKYFTTTALDQYVTNSDDHIHDIDISEGFHRESHHMSSIPRPSISQETIVEHCLQALLSHSTVEEQCSVMVNSLILPLFTKVILAHPDNPRLKSLVGKILSNISLFPAYHELLFMSGWVGTLARWKSSNNLLVSLPAIKTLANMDVEYGRHIFCPGIYMLCPQDRHVQHRNTLSNWGVDVVFIHGLWGGVFYTWRQQDKDNIRDCEAAIEEEDREEYSFCWPKDWLKEDCRQHVRVLGCDFDSYLSQWGNNCPTQSYKQNLEERSEDILGKLVRAGVGSRPVIFVGHSMGGLIIKKMLVSAQTSGDSELQRFYENTKGVVFYSTPHRGTHIAKMNSVVKYFFFPSVEVQELEIDSPALLELNTYFQEFVKKFQTRVISFGETIPTRHLGVDITFVPQESSDPGVGEFLTVPFNHMDICKPDSRKSILFRKFYNLLWDCLDDAMPFVQ